MTSIPADRPDEPIEPADHVEASEHEPGAEPAEAPDTEAFAEPTDTAIPDATVPVRGERWSRRRPLAIGFVAVAALLVSFAAGFGVGHDRGGERMVDASGRQVVGGGDERGGMPQGRHGGVRRGDHREMRGDRQGDQRGDADGFREGGGSGMRGDLPRMHDDDHGEDR
jgi:hypothetical protein